MDKKYIVTFSKSEQERLKNLATTGTQRVRKIAHADIPNDAKTIM